MQSKNLNWQIKVLDEANRIIQMTGSTEDFDRVGDRMLMSGVMLDNYLKNPVILANHDYGYNEKPTCIGKALDVRVQGKQLIFKIQFAETDNAKDWFYLYANKFMNASSIGFNPIKYEPNDQGGYDYTMWELLELSLVAVPCNPNAIQNAYRGGHISKSMYDFINQDNPKEVENMTDEEVKNLIQEQFKDVNKEIEGLKSLKTDNEKTIEDLKNEIKSLTETKGGAAISSSNHEKLKGIHENMKSCQKSMTDCVKAMKEFLDGVKPADNTDDGNQEPEGKDLEPTEAEQKMIEELAAKKIKEALGGLNND